MTANATPQRLTPRRAVALVAIAAVAAALGLVWSGRGDDAVRVPAGAQAGQLTLTPCTYHDLKADCGTLVVPENRHDPRSRLIALPVTRVRARSATPAEPIFRLEGGPGKTNMDFPQAGRYIDRHDLVLVGYRGVDGSVKLDCPEVEDARQRSGDLLAERSVRASADAFGDCARRLQAEGADLAGYSIASRVDDLEAARRALRYERVDLLSESAGTRTAMVYASRHPGSIHRSVMVGVNPPGRFLAGQKATAAQLKRLTGSDAMAASMRRTADDMPSRWGLLPIRRGNVLLASFFGLAESSKDAAPISSPMTLDAWRGVTRGDASGLWFQSFAATLIFPRAWVWGDAASIARADAAAAERHFAARPSGESPLGDAANRFMWAGGRMLKQWPENHDDDAYARIRTSRVETLLVSGTLDGATPLSGATRDLLRHLPNGHQVVLDGFGHTVDFWNQQPAAGTRLITSFLDHGRVDDSLYVPQRVDLSPELRQSVLAKALVGGMLLLAFATAASLLWLARRARSARPFGAKAGAFVRSVHAGLIGLGGWVLATLVAMVLLPDTPIDAKLLVVASVGVPAALAVHWASAGRGIAVTLAAGVLGAWLGFEAPGSSLGLLTAIPGAVAAANLAVVAREMAASPLPERVSAPAPRGAPA